MSINDADILKALDVLVTAEDEILLIHSSFKHLKKIEEAKWPLLSALRILVNRGHTVVIPSFTFSFIKNSYFDVNQSKSEVGILGDWFRELYGAERSLHPIYSFVYLGNLANEIRSVSADTCFSKDSIFSYFNQKKTRIILIGCDYQYTTQFHFYEELADVPYRYQKQFSGLVINGREKKSVESTMFVRDMDINPINDFSAIAGALKEKQQINHSECSLGTLQSFKEADAYHIAMELLRQDKLAFLKNRPHVEYALARALFRKQNPPIKIALMGNSNLTILEKSIKEQWQVYFKERSLELFLPEFGQSEKEILDNHSALSRFNPDYIIFNDTLEDIFHVNFLEDISSDQLNKLDEYFKLIEFCKSIFSAAILVNNFLNFYLNSKKSASYNRKNGDFDLVQQCNQRLKLFINKHENIYCIDLFDVLLSKQALHDKRLWYLGQFRYSEKFYIELAIKYIGNILSMTGNTIRLIALDLDHTLWGGVLGEEGIAGIQLGGDYPGNAYKDFQRLLLKLQARGIALAILSKNDEDLAIEAMSEHPHMLIRPSMLAAHFINWQEKSINLMQLSDQIKIGLQHILLIDDNPLEREKIREMLPEVKVLELPEDPALYSDALLSSPYIECVMMTEEDKKRTEFYAKNNSEIKKTKMGNIEDFLFSEEIKVVINDLTDHNFSRAIQLINKTNQFNTTAKRYSSSDLETIKNNSGVIIVVGVSDKSNEYENMGLFVLKKTNPQVIHIDLFLLSCRMLGKSVESAMLAWVYFYARKNNAATIIGEIKITPRNSPVRKLYETHGFQILSQNDVEVKAFLDINKSSLSVPPWLTLIDKTDTGVFAC